MDSQEYLNQISAKSAPVKGGPNMENKVGIAGIIRSKYFMFGAIALGLFILMAIIGVVLGSNKDDLKTKVEKLKLHIDGTSAVIESYQPNVKSSILRSQSASFGTLLSNTNSQLSKYIEEKYSEKANKISKNLVEEARTNQDALDAELFEAKINGNLDRVYAHKMAYEISLLTTEEASIIRATKDETLSEILSQSYDSLEKLYDGFNDFSETK